MKVLFCGGPWNGRWKDVDPDSVSRSPGFGRWVDAVAPPTPLDFAKGTGTLAKFRYRLWTIPLFGQTLEVAAPDTDHNESESVLYAVLQRDVADHLRGKS